MRRSAGPGTEYEPHREVQCGSSDRQTSRYKRKAEDDANEQEHADQCVLGVRSNMFLQVGLGPLRLNRPESGHGGLRIAQVHRDCEHDECEDRHQGERHLPEE